MGKFILQRQLGGGEWFDFKSYPNAESALQAAKWDRGNMAAAINSRGGTGWTGERPQNIRVIKVLD